MTIPYWRLSAFYFFYFASLGALVPYWGLYLMSLGFSIIDIGQLMAIFLGTKIVAPYLWGWIVDRHGQRMQVIRIASLFSILCFTGVFQQTDFTLMAISMFLFSFFWNASLPQFEATTLNYLADEQHRYAKIRLWGSVGFIITVLIVAVILENYGEYWLPYIVIVLFVLILFSSFYVHDKAMPLRPNQSHSIINIIKKPKVMALLIVCFLMQAAHAPYYSFYTLYLEFHAYSRSLIGFLWAFAVLMEVLFFIIMDRMIAKYGATTIIKFSLIMAIIRWWLLAQYIDNYVLLVLAQTLHAATFGSFHAAVIYLIHQYFNGPHQGRGQALYASVSFGLGGALGSLYAGYFWDLLGAQSVFLFAVILSLIASWIAFIYIKD